MSFSESFYSYIKFGANSSITTALNLPEIIDNNTYFKITKFIGKAGAGNIVHIHCPELNSQRSLNPTTGLGDIIGIFPIGTSYTSHIESVDSYTFGLSVPNYLVNNPTVKLYLTDESYAPFTPTNIEIEFTIYNVEG